MAISPLSAKYRIGKQVTVQTYEHGSINYTESVVLSDPVQIEKDGLLCSAYVVECVWTKESSLALEANISFAEKDSIACGNPVGVSYEGTLTSGEIITDGLKTDDAHLFGVRLMDGSVVVVSRKDIHP